MRALFSSFAGYFLTPGGVLAMGMLDSSLVFFLPLGLDLVVILMAARNPDQAWLYPLLAVAGGLAGAAFTFWLGRKLDTHGLSRVMDSARLDRVQKRVEHAAAFRVAALALIPPPFPFTPFILAAGAFDINPWRFFSGLAVFRLVRYGSEALLAAQFGSGITSWMESTTFKVIVGVFIVLAIGGTVVSAIRVARGSKAKGGGREA